MRGKYLAVRLYREGCPKGKLVNVHRLVAKAFLGPIPKAQFVCHGQKGRFVNCISNLYFGNHKSNLGVDKKRDGTDSIGERNGRALLTSKQVREIRRLKGKKSAKTIANQFSVSIATVYAIHSGRTWQHIT